MSTPFEKRDAVVLGGGIFGLYAARILLQKNYSVTLLERDSSLFSRASSINQARVHLGYHYPRSLGTAVYSVEFFNRFVTDFQKSIQRDFTKIYAVASRGSYTSAGQFEQFCRMLGIPCESTDPSPYFSPGTVEGCYKTREYTFDSARLLGMLLEQIQGNPSFELQLLNQVETVEKEGSQFFLTTKLGKKIQTGLVVNATYASVNQVLKQFSYPEIPVQYELTELALGTVPDSFKNIGITVMDGPFFSLLPHGMTGFHSLTGVEYTPHESSKGPLPKFSCQSAEVGCSAESLKNCDGCPAKPRTSVQLMTQLAKKFLNSSFQYHHEKSQFAVKAILKTSELDDSRPTGVWISENSPKFLSVLSGKINTIYELERVLG